eukprot:368309-Pyramimonas_sp.AAC.2
MYMRAFKSNIGLDAFYCAFALWWIWMDGCVSSRVLGAIGWHRRRYDAKGMKLGVTKLRPSTPTTQPENGSPRAPPQCGNGKD